MPQNRHKPEEIVAKLRQVEVRSAQGRPVVQIRTAVPVWLLEELLLLFGAEDKDREADNPLKNDEGN